MGESDLAVDHFVRLLKGEQGAFLEDFVLAFEVRRVCRLFMNDLKGLLLTELHSCCLQHLSSQNPEKVFTLSDELPEPVFDQKRTTIRSQSGTSSHKATDPRWAELQDRFLDVGYSSNRSRAKPRELLYSGAENIMSVDGQS